VLLQELHSLLIIYNPAAAAALCPAGVVCITAIIAGTFCWSRKRRLVLQELQQQQSKLKRPPGSSLGSKPLTSGVGSAGYDEECGDAVDVEALRMYDRQVICSLFLLCGFLAFETCFMICMV
jgi:hypothetical protein